MLLSRFVFGITCVGLLIPGASVFAQGFPTKPIRIVTAPAGGNSDFAARQVASGIADALAQPVIVDNRAGGIVPIEVVMKSPADGYTLLLDGASLWISPLF